MLGIAALLVIWCLGVVVTATNVPRTEVGDRTPAAANLLFDEVSFATHRRRDAVWLVHPV